MRSTNNASSAKDHIKSKHEDHPLAVIAEQKTTDKAKNDIDLAETEPLSILDTTSQKDLSKTGVAAYQASAIDASCTVISSGGNQKKRFFRPHQKMLNVLISKWVISQGQPYTATKHR